MKFIDSKHVRYTEKDHLIIFEVDMHENHWHGVYKTLKWAFPEAQMTNSVRGHNYLIDSVERPWNILLDFTNHVIYVYGNRGVT